MTQHKRKLALLFAGVLVLVASTHLAIVGLETWSIAHPPDKLRFDSKAWVANKNPEIRYRMALDLIETNQLSSCSSEEVKSLLGAPDQLDSKENMMKYETKFGWSPSSKRFFSVGLNNGRVQTSNFELDCPDTSFVVRRIAPWMYKNNWVSESIQWDSAVLSQLSSSLTKRAL